MLVKMLVEMLVKMLVEMLVEMLVIILSYYTQFHGGGRRWSVSQIPS